MDSAVAWTSIARRFVTAARWAQVPRSGHPRGPAPLAVGHLPLRLARGNRCAAPPECADGRPSHQRLWLPGCRCFSCMPGHCAGGMPDAGRQVNGQRGGLHEHRKMLRHRHAQGIAQGSTDQTSKVWARRAAEVSQLPRAVRARPTSRDDTYGGTLAAKVNGGLQCAGAAA
jgi:hypothetical protein